MKNNLTATTLPPSPGDDRAHRLRNYSITMGIRVLCFIAIPFAPGWTIWLFAAGAAFLPYFAVMFANTSFAKSSTVDAVEQSTLNSSNQPTPAGTGGFSSAAHIYVDYPVMSDNTIFNNTTSGNTIPGNRIFNNTIPEDTQPENTHDE
jgi:Protein of unknown function (DUF3099)